MKSYWEFKVTSPNGNITITEWLEYMADQRWELIGVNREDRYIFRRPVKDAYMEDLLRNMGRVRKQLDVEEDGNEKALLTGRLSGLNLAKLMYTK